MSDLAWRILFKNAYIFTGERECPVRGDLLVEGNVIARIALRPDSIQVSEESPPALQPAQVIDGSDLLLMPGFVDAHTHLLQTFGRGLMDGVPLTQWLRLIWDYDLSREGCYYSTLLGALEALMSGTTCVSEMITECRYPDAVVQAIVDSGLRATIGTAIADYMEGENTPIKATDAALAHAAEFAGKWHGAAGGRIRASIAPVGLPACTRDLMKGARELAAGRGLSLHTHACEGRAETESALTRFGKSEIAMLKECGVLTSRTEIVHVIWVSDDDIEIIAESGAAAVQCPSSNVRLLDGVTSVTAMRGKGIPVSLGGDGAASSGAYDLLVEGRIAALLQRLTTADAAPLGPAEVLAMLTCDGARAAGWAHSGDSRATAAGEGRTGSGGLTGPGVGQLVPGAAADILGFDLSSPRLAAADPQALLSNLVFAGSARDLRFVMIDGRLVVQDGIHLTVDTHAAVEKAKEVMREESIPLSGAWRQVVLPAEVDGAGE